MEYNVMKRYILFFGLALFAILCISGCLPDDMDYRENGTTRTVTIGVTTETPATKVDIGDDLVFSWTNGDQIAVWSGNGTSGQYYTSNAYAGGNKYTVALSGARSNYAVYPASIADGDNATSSSLKVKLPAEYDFRGTGANYSPMPMLATNTEGQNLEFKHLGGLLRISIGELPEGASHVTVDLGKKINGTFPVHINTSTGSYIVAGEATDGSTQAKFLVPSSGSVVLNLPVPTGEYSSITIKVYNADGDPLASESPAFSWNCARTRGKKLTSLEWVYVFSDLTDVSVSYSGGNASLASAFKSYRKRGDDNFEAIPFTLEYWDEATETWTTTAPSWLTSAPAGGSHTGGNAGEALNVSVPAQENSSVDEHHFELAKSERAKTDFDLSTYNVATGATVSRTTANCYVVQGSGTYKFPLVYGNGVKNGAVNESAYRGKAGPDATGYRPDGGEALTVTTQGVTETGWYLGSFKDHLDNNIYNGGDDKSSPYLTTHLGKNASDFTPVLIWTDEPGLVSVDAAISGSGEDSYLTFSVPAETITQGNALVAVLVNGVIAWSWHIWVTDLNLTANVVAPSGYSFPLYNLGWCEGRVLEEYLERSCQIRAVQAGSNTTTSATVLQESYLNSIRGNSPYYQWGRKDPLQASKGKSGENSPSKKYYPSNSTYTPRNGVAGKKSIGQAIQTPYVHYNYGGSSLTDWCDITYFNSWNSAIEGQGAGQFSTAVTKTIYDPSPVGFKMPPQAAFSAERNSPLGFNSSNLIWSEGTSITSDNGRIYNNTLFFPAAGFRIYSGAGGLYTVGQNGYYWSAVPCDHYGDETEQSHFGDSYMMAIFPGSVSCPTREHRSYGFSVRPVRE